MEHLSTVIAIPVFLLMILVEYFATRKEHPEYYRLNDALTNLNVGVSHLLFKLLTTGLMFGAYVWTKDHFAIVQLSGVWAYVVVFILFDFCFYWAHRVGHEVNLFWGAHVVHHQSEEYNLTVALRQSWIHSLLAFVFFLPIAFLGVDILTLGIVASLNSFYQFWIHTKAVKRMPKWFEAIFNSPAHHRVHHGVNPKYIDKNHAGMFIIWDKLFGTFQEELTEEPCVYGVRRPVRTWNPFLINTQHVWLLIKDAIRTKNWMDKIKVWFMPTGWRPKDIEEKYPVFYLKADDVYNFEKYNPKYSKKFQIWSQIHLTAMFLLMGFLFFNIKNLQSNNLYIYYGLFLLFSIFSYTTLMDKKLLGVITECINLLFVAGIVYTTQNWFGLNEFIHNGHLIVFSFFVLETIAAIYFYFIEFKKELKPQII